jgi:hypothetical protein
MVLAAHQRRRMIAKLAKEASARAATATTRAERTTDINNR